MTNTNAPAGTQALAPCDDELLPCPFCGSRAEIQWESAEGFVSCTNEDCYATSTWFSSDDAGWVKERIVPRWNRRIHSATCAQDAALVAALQEEVAALKHRQEGLLASMQIHLDMLQQARQVIAEAGLESEEYGAGEGDE